MTKNDLAELTKLIAGIWAARGKNVSEPLLEIFTLALNIYDITEIKNAVINYIRNPDNGQFLPTPADIIRHMNGNSYSQALHAWTKVTKAIQHVGSYSSIIFDDALIHAVISDMGGWISLCHTNTNELIFRGKEFEKRYCSYLIKKPTHYPSCLIGIVEHQNVGKGFVTELARLWGNERAAKLIYQQGQGASPTRQFITHFPKILPEKKSQQKLLGA